MKISVIIPVYNAEKYINECLDSVLSQSYKDIEVILVDDGSPDNSGKICDEYSERDERVIVIHTENGGISRARNTAMKRATGDYFMFIDNDDYWLSESVVCDVVKLLKKSKADILSFEYENFFSENKRPIFKTGNLPRENIVNKRTSEALSELLKSPPSVFSAVVHTKVVKASLIRDNSIEFPEGLYHEDTFFTARLIMHAKTYDRYNKVAYAFRRTNINSASTQGSKKKKNMEGFLAVLGMLLERYNVNNEPSEIYECMLDFLASPYSYALGMAAGALEFCTTEKERLEIIACIKELGKYKYLLKYSSRSQVKIVRLFCSVFGINLTVGALRVFLKLNRRNKLSINKKVD